MPLFGNKEERGKRRENRQSYRIEKIKALTAKAYAVAAKRKWFVYLIYFEPMENQLCVM